MPITPDPTGGGGGVGGTMYGLDAARPLPGTVADGLVYIAIDTNIAYQAQGGLWNTIEAPSYTNPAPTTATVGGIPSGTTFLDKTPAQMFTALLYPFLSPAFTAFSVDCGNVVEVGTDIAGARVFAFTWTNHANVNPPPAPNGFYLRDMTAGVNLEVAQPLASPINHVLGAPSVTVYHAIATNTYRIQGTDAMAAVFNTTFTVNWWWRYYSGPSPLSGPLNQAQIKALATSNISNTFVRTYSFAAGATYKYICYPSVWGMATIFKDALTMLDVPMEAVYVVNVTNTLGDATNYNVHRTTNIIGAAIDIIVS